MRSSAFLFRYFFIISAFLQPSCTQEEPPAIAPIDRQAVVSRHHVVYDSLHPDAPFSVGNGGFAMTVDFTGLQTFPGAYHVPLLTASEWGWHSFPNPEGYRLADASEDFTFFGEEYTYPTIGWPDRSDHPASSWLNRNPHKIMLGRLGFYLTKEDGEQVRLEDIKPIRQEWNLWEGCIYSVFSGSGKRVSVATRIHPTKDVVLLDIQSELLKTDKLGLSLQFPYAKTAALDPSDWDSPDKHESALTKSDNRHLAWRRQLDSATYYVEVFSETAITYETTGKHDFIILPQTEEDAWQVSVAFSPKLTSPDEDWATAQQAVQGYWRNFWSEGGVVDFSGSTDPRAQELERRIILSQFLMAIQCAGELPPQETGLSSNSWHGKFHLEMHWWHGAHFPLWGRAHLLEKSLGWYVQHLPKAKALAASQGYEGARWPKMVGPEGRESPGWINPFILWQQPHPIYYAELLYRNHPSDTVLQTYRNLVFSTADFLSSVLRWEEQQQRYVLGPPVAPVQEVHPALETVNPTFELAYFHFGLQTAQQWRERLNLPPSEKWAHILQHLSPLPTQDSFYVATESAPDIWEKAVSDTCAEGYQFSLHDFIGGPCQNVDHPSFLGAMGFLPGNMANADTMHNTLKITYETWDFDRAWGWDFPFMAMTAARVGDPELAIDILMMDHPKNHYQSNGWMTQGRTINPYLPANGGLLSATAMMIAGWDGNQEPLPGFPKNGKWQIKHEGLMKMP